MEIGEPKKRIEIVPVEEPVPTMIPSRSRLRLRWRSRS